MTRTLKQWLQLLADLSHHQLTQHPKDAFLNCYRASCYLNINRLNCPVVTIGGTNGKGSCATLLASIFHQAGYQVGLFTSPHLFKFNERISINNQAVDDQSLCDAFSFVIPLISHLSLNYFQVITLVALWLFHYNDLDLVILEVGLGGIYDPVNVIDADIAVISSISLDHTQQLGETRELIAKNKMGIARVTRPVVCGETNPPAIIKQMAKLNRLNYFQLGDQFSFEHLDQSSGYWHWCYDGEIIYDDLVNPKILFTNAATTLMVVYLLQATFKKLDKLAIDQGLLQQRLLGRCQLLEGKPSCLIDIAHNVAATTVLAKEVVKIEASCRRAIFAVMADKDIQGMLACMSPVIDYWYLADIDHFRAVRATEIAKFLLKNQTFCFANINEAYCQARLDASDDDLLVVFGSCYALGELKILDNVIN